MLAVWEGRPIRVRLLLMTATFEWAAIFGSFVVGGIVKLTLFLFLGGLEWKVGEG